MTGVLVIAAVLVYVVRKYVGDTGRSPLGGIKVSPLSPKEYLGAILAIFASLWGGIVLSPEVALVATGSVIGGLAAKFLKVTDPKDVKKVVELGALGGILALFVGPILSGNMRSDSTATAIGVDQLGWAILVAIIATIAVTVARLIAALVARATSSGPHLPILIDAALIIAATALIMQAWTGEDVIYITTSGEEPITELPTLTSASTVAAIILLNTIAYAVSIDAGFRGAVLPGHVDWCGIGSADRPGSCSWLPHGNADTRIGSINRRDHPGNITPSREGGVRLGNRVIGALHVVHGYRSDNLFGCWINYLVHVLSWVDGKGGVGWGNVTLLHSFEGPNALPVGNTATKVSNLNPGHIGIVILNLAAEGCSDLLGFFPVTQGLIHARGHSLGVTGVGISCLGCL